MRLARTKHALTTVVVTAAGLAMAIHAVAAEPSPAERIAGTLKEKLALTDPQTTEVRCILDAAMRETRDELAGGSKSQIEMMLAFQKRREATDTKIQAVLNEEQKPKYLAGKETWRQEGVRKQMLASMKEKLTLTDAQATQIDGIVAAAQKDLLKARQENAGRPLMLIRAAQSFTGKTEKQIEAVLTETQRPLYEKMKKERQEQMRSQLQEQW